MTLAGTTEQLPYLSTQERLQVYNYILSGCQHIWGRDSKTKKRVFRKEKATKMLQTLIELGYSDPYFLAQLVSYVMVNMKDVKDLQVLATYANALSDANGEPFSPGSSYTKPNLRLVSAAALQMMDPKLASRIAELATFKFSVPQRLRIARHFPSSLLVALKKYLEYRENNIEIMRGIQKIGLGNVTRRIYRTIHKAPTPEAAQVLRWQQKKGEKVRFENSEYDFSGLTQAEIAKRIQERKLKVLPTLGALRSAITPIIAVALLEQATGDQAVILRKTFEDAGVLHDPEVLTLYEEKIRTAKTALDRVDKIQKDISESVKQVLKEARSAVRKEQVGDIGKVFLHLDFSGSMGGVLEFARERGTILAECVKNPEENFRWGLFGGRGVLLPLPREFTKDAFAQILYGRTGLGSTNCFALYPQAREFGAEIDIFVSDQEHTDGNLEQMIKEYHTTHPTTLKPKGCVIINFNFLEKGALARAYEANGIPVALLSPNTLIESALVTQAIKAALLGPTAVIDEIMAVDLLKLPKWYLSI